MLRTICVGFAFVASMTSVACGAPASPEEGAEGAEGAIESELSATGCGANGCCIHQDKCARYPLSVGTFGDRGAPAGVTPTIRTCVDRAAQFHAWCGNGASDVTTASYRVNGKPYATCDNQGGDRCETPRLDDTCGSDRLACANGFLCTHNRVTDRDFCATARRLGDPCNDGGPICGNGFVCRDAAGNRPPGYFARGFSCVRAPATLACALDRDCDAARHCAKPGVGPCPTGTLCGRCQPSSPSVLRN